MPDDMLRDAIETSRRVLNSVSDFETQGECLSDSLNAVRKCNQRLIRNFVLFIRY